MTILLKTNLCGTTWQKSICGMIWQKSMPKKFSFRGSSQCKLSCEMWEIILGSFCFSLQIISQDNGVNTDNVPLLMFSSKVWFIVIWCRTFQNFEWSLPLQFSKYCETGKINSHSYLIPATPIINPLLSGNVIVLWIQVYPKKRSLLT